MDVAAFVVLTAVVISFRPHRILWFAGLAVAFVSFPLWILARIQLGSAFTVRPEARRLVTHGLYSRIRHPIYAFGTMAIFGVMFALQIWPILAVWLALTPMQFVRIRREERILRSAFGERYDQYRSGTWF